MPPSASSALQATWASGRRDAARLSGVRGAGGQRALPLTDPTHFPSVLHCGLSWGPHPPRRPDVGAQTAGQGGRVSLEPWGSLHRWGNGGQGNSRVPADHMPEAPQAVLT